MEKIVPLLPYWSIAIGLLFGGLYALHRGFGLVLSARGKTKEESSIEFFGLKATVGTIGSFVMLTAFMWGWIATFALPNYKSEDVSIDYALQLEHLKDTQRLLARIAILSSEPDYKIFVTQQQAQQQIQQLLDEIRERTGFDEPKLDFNPWEAFPWEKDTE